MKIKNWGKFQHFKDRKPTWIKLYRDLLNDYNWFKLDDKSSKILINIWLIAAEYDGNLPDVSTLSFRLRVSEEDMNNCLEKLMACNFITEGEVAASVVDSKDLAKKNGFGSRYIKDAVKLEVKERDKGVCVQCQSKENIEFDHIIPVSKGGGSEIDNIQLLCRSCNRAKRNKLLRKAKDLRSLEKETEKEKEKKKKIDPRVSSVFDHYFKTFKKTKATKLTKTTVALIERALKRGHDVEILLKAITGMSNDDWEGRVNNDDLVYAIGDQKGIDKVVKWASYEPTKVKSQNYSGEGEDFDEEIPEKFR